MKKYDFKIDFTKRDVISLVCFTFVMVLVLILGNTFGYVSADDSGYLLNLTDYESSSSYNSNVYCKWFGGNVSENSSISYDYFVNDLDISSFNFEGSDSIKYYMIIGASYVTKDWVYLFPDDTFCYIWTPYTYSNTFRLVSKSPTYYRFTVSSWGDGNNLDHLFIGSDDVFETVTATSTMSIGDETYYYIDVGDPGHLPILSNMNYYSFGSDVGYYDYTDTLISYLTSGLGSVYDINYMPHVGLNGFNSLVGVGGSDGENSSNNLYLNNPYWSFNLPHNNQLTSTNGTVTFNAVPTEYQNEHPNQFELHYWFQIDVTYTYKDNGDGGFSGAGHGFCILNSIQPTKSLGTTVTRSRTGIFKYRYNGSDYALSPFLEFDGSQTFQTITVGTGWNKLFRQCYLSGNTSYNTFYDWWKDYGRTTATDNDSLPIVTSAKLKCYAQLFDSTSSSGICAYYYDFLTGESGVLDDSMGVNSNPYDFDTQEQYTNQSSGYGYVVQNNNQTVNVTNNVSSDVQNEISNIITGVDDSNESNWVSTLTSLLQANAFISFMSSTFGFIPSAFWTALSTFFITCLAFLTGFVLLRVLLDLL